LDRVIALEVYTPRFGINRLGSITGGGQAIAFNGHFGQFLTDLEVRTMHGQMVNGHEAIQSVEKGLFIKKHENIPPLLWG